MYRTMIVLVLMVGLGACEGTAADWPMWHCDAQRSGLTTQTLPAELSLRWMRQLPKRRAAWEHTVWMHRLYRDIGYSPVVCGKSLYVGCSHNGAVLALDTETGAERWRFYTNGPIRFAPIATPQTVYVAGGDGCLYALDAATGAARWRVRGGPRERRMLGHERLISAWPASAGPVLVDGIVVFVAGLWPTDGIFVHGVDARSGEILWTYDGIDFRPCHYLTIKGDRVLVSGVRGGAILEWKTGARIKERFAAPRGRPPSLPDPPGVEGRTTEKIAADDKLFVATAEGRLYCFAAKKAQPAKRWPTPTPPADSGHMSLAVPLLEASGVRAGYSLVWGLNDGRVVEQLVRHTALRVIAMDADAKKVNGIRRRLDALRLFDSHRLAVMVADPAAAGCPPYMASLITSENPAAGGFSSPAVIAAAFRSLRPYGGTLAVPGERRAAFNAAAKQHALARAEVSRGNGYTLLRRAGALPGAADWTHEFADAGNRLAVRDKLVRAPLGVLWYGGPSAHHRYYLDGAINTVYGGAHVGSPLPPQAQFVRGRTILQSRALLSAFDQYTGLPLWEAKLPDTFVFDSLGIHARPGLTGMARRASEPWRYPPAMKAEVPPTHRSRSSGYNYVSVPDGIYVAAGPQCLRFHPEDGRQLSSWQVPLPPLKEEPWCWGSLRVVGGLLVATAFRPSDVAAARAGHDGNGGAWVKDRMRMAHVLAVDRYSGELRWSRQARIGFLNRGIAAGGGRVFCVDLVPDYVMAAFAKSGKPIRPQQPTLRAFDLRTGADAWSVPLDMMVMQLTYSPEHDILLAPSRLPIKWQKNQWVDLKLKGRRGGRRERTRGLLRALRGSDGRPLYELAEFSYFEPHCLLGNLLIDRYCYPYDLLTGRRAMRVSRLTGAPEPWTFDKNGCNHLVACDGLIPFRSGFYDLAEGAGGCRLRQMDGGCTPSHIPAGGLLNAPNFGIKHDYSRTTAMAYVHRPDNEVWLRFRGRPPTEPTFLKRAGFNFGAPGDRGEPGGALWLAVPSRSGNRFASSVSSTPAKAASFRFHAARLGRADAAALPWVAASGTVGIQQIVIPAGFRLRAPSKPHTWTVRLHFAEPEDLKPGQRVFSVGLQGKEVLKGFDVVKAAGGPRRATVREFKGIKVEDKLIVTFKATAGEPIVCGIEVMSES